MDGSNTFKDKLGNEFIGTISDEGELLTLENTPREILEQLVNNQVIETEE